METWKPIPSFPLYEASSLGRVRRKLRQFHPDEPGEPLQYELDRYDYPIVKLSLGSRSSKTTKAVHLLVCEAFHGPRPAEGMEVDHVDGVKTNLAESNLEWVTPIENQRRATERGLRAAGKRHGRYTKPERTARGHRVNTSKLTEENVLRVWSLTRAGVPRSEVARTFGVTREAIYAILKRRNWKHLAPPPPEVVDGADATGAELHQP